MDNDQRPVVNDVSAPAPQSLSGNATLVEPTEIPQVQHGLVQAIFPHAPAVTAEQSPFRFSRLGLVLTMLFCVAILAIGIGSFLLGGTRYKAASSTPYAIKGAAASALSVENVDGYDELLTPADKNLSINGELSVNGAFTITPTKAPAKPAAGQLYFDKTSHLLNYYNGTDFVSLMQDTTNTKGLNGTNGLNGAPGPAGQQGPQGVQGLQGAQGVAGASIDPSILANAAFVNKDNQVFTGNNQLFTNAADSTTAFRIQNSAGTSNLVVADTLNTKVGVGLAPGAAGAMLQVADSVAITSGGTDDSVLSYLNGNNGFFEGLDSADNTFKISSKSSNSSTRYGLTSVAGNQDGGNGSVIIANKVDVGNGGGTVSDLQIYISGFDPSANHMQMAIYDASGAGGTPGNKIASSGTQPVVLGWNSFPITATLSPNTSYYFAFNADSSNTFTRFSNVGYTNSYCLSGTPLGTWPATFGTPTCSLPWVYSLYADISGVTGDPYVNSLVSLSSTGQFTLHNFSDSAQAFQIQNSNGTVLLSADTADMQLTVEKLVVNTSLTVQSLVVNATLTINGHIIAGGTTPSATVNTSHAGTGATCTVTGTDTAGLITITTGTGTLAGANECTLTYASSFASAPKITLTPANGNSSVVNIYSDSGVNTTSSMDISFGQTPSSGTYAIYYQVIQ